MRASDICTLDVVCIHANASATDAAKLMRKSHAGALVVIKQPDGERVPVGVVTDRDIVMSVVAADVPAASLTVGDIMSSPALTCGEDHHLIEIISIMRTKAIRRLPVVDAHGVLAGMVTADDVYLALGVLLHEMNAAITDEQTREHELRV